MALITHDDEAIVIVAFLSQRIKIFIKLNRKTSAFYRTDVVDKTRCDATGSALGNAAHLHYPAFTQNTNFRLKYVDHHQHPIDRCARVFSLIVIHSFGVVDNSTNSD